MSLFGVDMRGIFQSAMGSLLNPLTLKRREPGPIDPLNPSVESRVETSWPCRGVVEVLETFVEGGITRMQTGEATVLLGQLPMGIRPRAGDRLVFVVPGSEVEQEGEILDPNYDPADVQATMRLAAVSGP